MFNGRCQGLTFAGVFDILLAKEATMSVTLKVTCDRCGKTSEIPIVGAWRLIDIETVLLDRVKQYNYWIRFAGKDLCRKCAGEVENMITKGDKE